MGYRGVAVQFYIPVCLIYLSACFILSSLCPSVCFLVSVCLPMQIIYCPVILSMCLPISSYLSSYHFMSFFLSLSFLFIYLSVCYPGTLGAQPPTKL
ncbi:hypothetical protein GDO86_003433 [Hymenochirus boettgeri]|uniref:Uncharacterized protein n=1 Tax=Hymenochirus boettgeri TaxID=247094 RepID=A0A8T2K408_9PIPI|nr:hypothetical protein GDO86_003433 [Hymenochirus boettgeri]